MLMANSVEGRFPFLDRQRGRARRIAAGRVQAARARREARAEARGRGPRARSRFSSARSSRTARRTRCRSRATRRASGSTRSRRRARSRRPASSTRPPPRADREVPRARPRPASSRTPTTWPSSACSRRSSCTITSSRVGRRPTFRRRHPHGRRSTDRAAGRAVMLVHQLLEDSAAPDAGRAGARSHGVACRLLRRARSAGEPVREPVLGAPAWAGTTASSSRSRTRSSSWPPTWAR